MSTLPVLFPGKYRRQEMGSPVAFHFHPLPLALLAAKGCHGCSILTLTTGDFRHYSCCRAAPSPVNLWGVTALQGPLLHRATLLLPCTTQVTEIFFSTIAPSASASALLPGKSHGQRSLVGYSPWGRKESDKTSLSLLQLVLASKGKQGLCTWLFLSSDNTGCFSKPEQFDQESPFKTFLANVESKPTTVP